MLKLVTANSKLVQARSLLAKAMTKNAQTSTHTISTPGGQVVDAAVFRHPALDLWGHVASGLWNRNRYFCGFGIGEPSWQVALEINIPVMRLLSCSGQIVEDNVGRLYYAHRGGLGGGKFSVPALHFADLIRGFEREPVDAGSKEIPLFILGRIGERRLPDGLADYVHEAHRIREIRRNRPTYIDALRKAGVPSDEADGAASDDFKPETIRDQDPARGTKYLHGDRTAFRLQRRSDKATQEDHCVSGLSTKRVVHGSFPPARDRAPALSVRRERSGQISGAKEASSLSQT